MKPTGREAGIAGRDRKAARPTRNGRRGYRRADPPEGGEGGRKRPVSRWYGTRRPDRVLHSTGRTTGVTRWGNAIPGDRRGSVEKERRAEGPRPATECRTNAEPDEIGKALGGSAGHRKRSSNLPRPGRRKPSRLLFCPGILPGPAGAACTATLHHRPVIQWLSATPDSIRPCPIPGPPTR